MAPPVPEFAELAEFHYRVRFPAASFMPGHHASQVRGGGIEAAALALLARHDVVPVWMRDPAEAEALPAHGLMELRDVETGRGRMLWLRPALKQRWLARVQAHRREVQACMARHQRVPLVLTERFDAEHVTGYFAARS